MHSRKLSHTSRKRLLNVTTHTVMLTFQDTFYHIHLVWADLSFFILHDFRYLSHYAFIFLKNILVCFLSLSHMCVYICRYVYIHIYLQNVHVYAPRNISCEIHILTKHIHKIQWRKIIQYNV